MILIKKRKRIKRKSPKYEKVPHVKKIDLKDYESKEAS